MKVAHIVSSLENAAAGPSYSVVRLAEALAAGGQDVEVLSTARGAQNVQRGLEISSCQRLHRVDFDVWPLRRMAFSRELSQALDEAAVSRPVFHSHGLWLMPNFYPAISARRHDCVHIISPRGMLAPAALRFSRWRKRLLWVLAQKRVLDRATCLHATSQQEVDEIRALGIKQPVAVIPNGVDVPELNDTSESRDISRADGLRTLLYLGRMHPKKGLDRLVTAWSRLEVGHSDWQLRLVGPSENGYRQRLEEQVQSLRLCRVSFEDGLYASEKSAAYQNADLFVLPTLNENFGMVVAEALSHATPVICTRDAPWQGLRDYDCGWWIEQGVEPLVATLDLAMKLPSSVLLEKGRRGRRWMADALSWQSIALDMEQVYRWCTQGGQRPDCVDVLR